jgi:hypothetical protein
MGNVIRVLDKNGNQIGTSSHGLACSAYITEIIQKYIPNYNMFEGMFKKDYDINKVLEPVYENATKEDKLILHIFLNDKSIFEEKEDVSTFESAIKRLNEKNGYIVK